MNGSPHRPSGTSGTPAGVLPWASGRVAGQLAYSAIFVIALPLLLAVWSARLDRFVDLPLPAPPRAGVVLVFAGVLVVLSAVVTLRVRGGGWPMSPFPPARRVTSGMYAIFANPIYAGSVLAALGAAIALRSGAGVWIVTPVLALSCAAFVFGYEKEATDLRFGSSGARPLLRLAADADAPPAAADRISTYILVFFPWYVLYEAVRIVAAGRRAVSGYGALDALIPVVPWSELLYILDYPFLLVLPLVLRSSRTLRELMIRGWLAIASVSLFYLIVPVAVPPRPFPGGSRFDLLLTWERSLSSPTTAFPAFHVIWALLAAAAYSRDFPRLRLLWWLIAAAITISCVTTGMHAAGDIVLGVAFALVILTAKRWWRALLDGSEWIASSWRERDLGPIRFLSHGIWAGAGAFAGLCLIAILGGDALMPAATAIAAATIVGAAVWAQLLEGSSKLLRPYGYYGGLAGALIAIALSPLFGVDGWLLLGGYAVAGTVVQAFGRVRCLVQGCCHGRPAPESIGIRYSHPRSRVTRLSDLAGEALHPTQVYSIAWNLVTLAVLVRLWTLEAPLGLIAGFYLILNGLGRFVEEHYRGEPQTMIIAGMRAYQWLAILCLIGGAALTVFGNRAAPPMHVPSATSIATALVAGVVTYVAYGVDFPRLNGRFSRLV